MSDRKHISHWIGGQPWTGVAERHGDIYDPATGQVTGTVDFASAAVVGRRGGRGGQGVPRLARRLAGPADRDPVPVPRAARGARRRAGRAGQRRARQGHLGRGRRGGPRPRGGGVRLRHPAPAQGRLLGERVHRRGRLLDPPAARRGGRDHPVQLPGHGADVDVPAGHRVRQHVRAQAVREGPVGLAAAGPAVGRGGPAGRRVQRGPGGQGSGGRAAHPPGRPRGQLRRIDPDRALRL